MDGICIQHCREDVRSCILVVVGVTDTGHEVVAIDERLRESELSWIELPLAAQGPGRASAETGYRGRFAGLLEGSRVFSEARQQRCWVHKTANVLNDYPKALRSQPKQCFQAIWMAESKQRGSGRFRWLHNGLQGKISQGYRMPVKGPGDSAVVLRFPHQLTGGSISGPPTRSVDLRHRSSPHRKDRGLRLPTADDRKPGNFKLGMSAPETMASPQRD